jgi:hypothetical protein
MLSDGMDLLTWRQPTKRRDVLKAVEIEVPAILARSEDRVALEGGRRHEEGWQEQG